MSLNSIRIRYLVLVGVPAQLDNAAKFHEIAESAAIILTRTTGGLTWGICNGTWIHAAETGQGPWHNAIAHNIEVDFTAWFSLVFSPDMEDAVYATLKGAFAARFVSAGLSVCHIHVERTTCEARHFLVSN